MYHLSRYTDPSDWATEPLAMRCPSCRHEATLDRLDMDWLTFHTFRHTCASLLFANGKNIKQVQEWLGHADPSLTLRTYVHLMDDGLGAADFLDRAVGNGDVASALA